jgi:prepilin-type N-terminal cleavage/methylation domain-containing protein
MGFRMDTKGRFMRTAASCANKGQGLRNRRLAAGHARRGAGLCPGYSLIELLATVVIILIISGIAIPSMLRMMNGYQLTATARSISDLVERARYEAIKQNTKINLHFTLGAVPQSVWVDVNGTGTLAGNDPKAFYPGQVLSTGTSIPAVTSMNFPTVTQVANTGVITFDSRGAIDYTGVVGGPTVWILYFTMNNDASYGAKAITVEPYGRSKVWSSPPGSGNWQVQ